MSKKNDKSLHNKFLMFITVKYLHKDSSVLKLFKQGIVTNLKKTWPDYTL